MIYYIAFIRNNEIEVLKLASGNNEPEGLREDGSEVVHIDFAIDNRNDFIMTHYWDDEWKEREVSPNKHSKWVNNQWEWSWDDLIQEVREIRNRLLQSSDWTQMSDSPLSEDEKLDWQIYREELRSLSFVEDNISNVKDVDWPKKPK